MSSAVSKLLFKGVVMAVLLGFVVANKKEDDEISELCKTLNEKPDGTKFFDECKKSEVVKQKKFIPKHLRPPWLDITLFSDNILDKDKQKTNCYACYKGNKASHEHFDQEEYCACQFEGKAPNDAFGKLFGEIDLRDKLDNCMPEFFSLALMPKCGNDNYDHIKHCAIVHFYNNEPSKEPEEAEFKRTLALLDGCVTGISKECTATVKVQFKEIKTGFFSGNCYDEIKTALESEFKWKEDKSSENDEAVDDSNTFTLPVLLQHRKCSGLTTATISDLFKDITVTIEGCGDSKSFTLRDLDASKGRVQEMRGIQLKMEDGKVAQWTDEKENGYNYSAKNEQKWTPMSLDNINKFGKSKLPPY